MIVTQYSVTMVQPRELHGYRRFWLRAHLVFAIPGGLYLAFICLLAIPFFQTHMVYLHAVPNPLFANYDVPEKYGLAPGKTFNFKIHTADNVSLGAWFVLSDTFYHTLPTRPAPSSFDSIVPTALKTRPTILFFHGNAAARAAPFRVATYSALSSRLAANVLVVDYRGFGDSTGKPSPDGLACDARTTWNWLINAGANPADVLVVGHSLGTAVAARLAAELGHEDVPLRGLVLLSPFSSMRTLLDTYAILGIFPFGMPLTFIPGASRFVTWSLRHRFDTLQLITDINVSVLIAHAENDWEVLPTHSDVLFNALLEPLLPSLPPVPSTLSPQEWSTFHSKQSYRKEKRDEIVKHTSIDNFGTLDEFRTKGRMVILLKTLDGGHNAIGRLEGVQDVVRKTFQF